MEGRIARPCGGPCEALEKGTVPGAEVHAKTLEYVEMDNQASEIVYGYGIERVLLNHANLPVGSSRWPYT